jgi:hypothetical protein
MHRTSVSGTKTNIAVARPNISGMRLLAQFDFLALKDVRNAQ